MSTSTKKVTMAEVAERAQVSKATVSRALAGSTLIGPEVRQQIEEIAEELGYVRRKVRRHGERCILTVKLVLPASTNRTRNLFFSLNDLVDGLRQGLSPAGANVIVETSSSNFEPFPHKKGGEIEAFVFAFHRPTAAVLETIQSNGAKVVVLNRVMKNVQQVINHHRQAMDLVADHLFERGIKGKCCFVSYKGIEEVTRARLTALNNAFERLQVPFDKEHDVWIADSPEDVNEDGLKSRVGAGFKTFVSVNDVAGAFLLQHARSLNLNPPEDLLITGCDNSPLRALTIPPLTSVDLSMHNLAREAGKALYQDIIEGQTVKPLLKVRGKLLPGGTT